MNLIDIVDVRKSIGLSTEWRLRTIIHVMFVVKCSHVVASKVLQQFYKRSQKMLENYYLENNNENYRKVYRG